MNETHNQTEKSECGFYLSKYYELLDKSIHTILSRPENDVLTYDILDTEKSKSNKLLALKEKQRQMKVGEIWQEVLGNYNGCVNLKIGHETGLDILSHTTHTKKFAIELKNRTNTDNASSKKSNLDKLAKFKKSNPEYTCIYANINADTEKTTLQGCIKKIIHDGVEIEHHVGYEFLKFILGDDDVDEEDQSISSMSDEELKQKLKEIDPGLKDKIISKWNTIILKKEYIKRLKRKQPPSDKVMEIINFVKNTIDKYT